MRRSCKYQITFIPTKDPDHYRAKVKIRAMGNTGPSAVSLLIETLCEQAATAGPEALLTFQLALSEKLEEALQKNGFEEILGKEED